MSPAEGYEYGFWWREAARGAGDKSAEYGLISWTIFGNMLVGKKPY